MAITLVGTLITGTGYRLINFLRHWGENQNVIFVNGFLGGTGTDLMCVPGTLLFCLDTDIDN